MSTQAIQEHHQIPDLQPIHADQNLGEHKVSRCNSTLKYVAVAVAVSALAVGVLGLLVYLGQLDLALTGVGSMAPSTGFYFAVGGFAATLASVIGLGISSCTNRAKKSRI